jgi:hypothetical protein
MDIHNSGAYKIKIKRRNSDIFNGNTPYPLLLRGGNPVVSPLSKRG